jgi:hypothetical protein
VEDRLSGIDGKIDNKERADFLDKTQKLRKE